METQLPYPGRTLALVLLEKEPNAKERCNIATQNTNRFLILSLRGSFPKVRTFSVTLVNRTSWKDLSENKLLHKQNPNVYGSAR